MDPDGEGIMINVKTAEIKKLDIIVPVALDLDWPVFDGIVNSITELHSRYGFHRFALACPGGGWRSGGYPPREKIEEMAHLFSEIKNRFSSCGIECGWWNTLTVKSGQSAAFSGIVTAEGKKHPFGNCPLDESFQRRFAADVALFAKIAGPAFILFEDDYSLAASNGCYCEKHLREFARRQGRAFSREEIVSAMRERTPEALTVTRAWQALRRDSLAELAAAVRRELDKETPHIPAGIMQSGSADADGDSVEAIARALAGERHTPFARLFGAFYSIDDTKGIPALLYHSLYNKQHISGDFLFYHETDTYPHTRFYTSASHIKAMMAAVFSYGFDGSVFITQQLLDHPDEETVYGRMFREERGRFETVHQLAGQCRLKGAEIGYDPFWNTADQTGPSWVKPLSRFGIPYTTLPSDVAFWDACRAGSAEDDRILEALRKTVFLDGDAAAVLCQRGYGAYLGVRIGGDVTEGSTLGFDLGAREVIRDLFAENGSGRNMPSAHMYNPRGNGRMRAVVPTDSGTEVITEYFGYDRRYVAASMTRYENRLGGKVVVMGLTVNGNNSHALYNYRRKRILERMLIWADCDFAFVKGAPEVFCIENAAADPAAAGFQRMLTLTNYCEDPLEAVELYLPRGGRNVTQAYTVERDGGLKEAAFALTQDGLLLREELAYLTPLYLVIN